MKQRLLFVIDSLNVGGAEKSLLTLLSLLDYSRYDVDLQLFGYGGVLEKYLPKEVKLLPQLPFCRFLSLPRWRQLASLELKKLWSGWRFSHAIKHPGITHADRARLYWSFFSKYFGVTPHYDCAIAYSQNLPTLYVAEKVSAKKKIAWVNVKCNLNEKNKKFYEPHYRSYDKIVTVSESSRDEFIQVYPQFSDNIKVIHDIIDPRTIIKMAEEDSSICLRTDVPSLLTMARLNRPQKGYDISLEAARLLKERGVNYCWYALGEGPYRMEMEQFICENHLEDTFVLLGTMANPYPVLKQCRLYVQTSRHEGFGLSIAEARILNKPVVTTEFDAVYEQMVPGKNGLVVPQDPVAVADAIERLLNDKILYENIVKYQCQEKKGNIEEIKKFYNQLSLI